jgi:cystathionine beta-lyase/cystathionine gamma-synthase
LNTPPKISKIPFLVHIQLPTSVISSEVVYEEAYNDFEDTCNNNNITVKIIDEEISKLTKKIINRYE